MLLLAFVVAFNSCESSYVATRPTYTEYARPQQPSPSHFWIEGDWNWNRGSRSYERANGHWEQQRPGRNYQQGSWQTNTHGNYWRKGGWRR